MIKEAIAIGKQTLVGIISKQYPLKSGNCFSLLCNDKIAYKIVNFNLENLEELLRRKVLEWNIKIKILDDERRIAVIHDKRIPHDWYQIHFCTVCCPYDLLPIQQQLEMERKYESGELRDTSPTSLEDGSVIVITKVNNREGLGYYV